MSESLVSRLSQLNEKVLNGHIKTSELEEYKCLLESANAMMEAQELNSNKEKYDK